MHSNSDKHEITINLLANPRRRLSCSDALKGNPENENEARCRPDHMLHVNKASRDHAEPIGEPKKQGMQMREPNHSNLHAETS